MESSEPKEVKRSLTMGGWMQMVCSRIHIQTVVPPYPALTQSP